MKVQRYRDLIEYVTAAALEPVMNLADETGKIIRGLTRSLPCPE